MSKHLNRQGNNIDPALSPERLDVLLILPPLYVFMKREFPSFRLGPGYLVSYLKERGITSRIYNADIYKPIHQGNLTFGSVLKKFIRAIGGYAYFAKHWLNYYDQVNDLDSPVWQDLRIVLRAAKPRVVGISALMITVPSAIVAAKIVREELSGAKVIVGGPAATTCAEELIHNETIDFLVLGEGEDTFTELTSFLLGREGSPECPEGIRGIMYRREKRIVTTPPRPLIADLDSIPFPDRDSMFILGDGGKFQTIRSNEDILTSRGCPYLCKFCCAFVVWGTHKVRFRRVDNILAEIIHLNRTYGQSSFVFWDDTFTVDRERIVELCVKIISSGLDIEWVCLLRLNTIDAELLAIMKRAGCREIQIGIESGNDRILKHIGKDFTVASIFDKLPMIKTSGIELGIFMIIGFPSETRSEMEETLRLIDVIKPAWVSISIFTPYPGTDFFRELKDQGRISGDFMRGDYWYPNNNYTGTMEGAEFKRFAIKALNHGDRYNMRRFFCPSYAWKKLCGIQGKK